MSKLRKPGLISRLFFKSQWSLRVRPEGIQLVDRLVTWETIKQAEVAPKLFWGHLTITDGSKVVELRGMNRRLAVSISLTANALRSLLPASKLLTTALNSDRYVSNRIVRRILTVAGESLKKWHLKDVPLLEVDLNSLSPSLEELGALALGDFSNIEKRNDLFISKEAQLFDSYFSQVEEKVLTHEQRIASIIMEDRNLVIAAAGSGKTSVLVAKIGYLIEKGYASPDEILVLSFNSSVAKEIEGRINKRLIQSNLISSMPRINTFHAFGLNAIKESGPPLRLAALALSADLRSREINKIFVDLIEQDSEFQADAIRFMAMYSATGVEDEAPQLAAELGLTWKDLISKPIGSIVINDPGRNLYTTLSGDYVRSKQELQIANWLTLMGVDFKYEKTFPAIEEFPWTRDYRPDFYYPSLDLWHEHFGINIFGKAPPHWTVSKDGLTYEQQAIGKRQALKAAEARWFETTSGDFETGKWEEKLHKSLVAHGAKPALIEWSKFTELSAEKNIGNSELLGLLGTAIAHYKSNNLSMEDLFGKAKKTKDHQRNESFIRLFKKIYGRYQELLAEREEIDFDDMLRIASQRIHAAPPIGRYKAILIDEFQDMSNARAELVTSLLHQNPEASLFAVGDDWQSIYRFAGSDIRVMTQFQDIYGFTKQATLATTFRCNQGIANLSSEFVSKNPSQIKKSVTSISDQKKSVLRIVFHSGSIEPVLVTQLEGMASWAQSRGRTAEVCLLARYNFLEPENFTALAEKYKEHINLSFSSIHRAKGMGYDFVIVIGMTSKVGSDFPSTRQDDPVLSLFMPSPDALEFSEERRLLYVAMTRTKQACVLLTPKFYGSPFVSEILKTRHQESILSLELDQDVVVEIPEPLTAAMQQVCPQCQRGRLLPRISKYGPFMVCERKDRGQTDCKNIQGHVLPGRLTRRKY
jgi:DNA helicase-4